MSNQSNIPVPIIENQPVQQLTKDDISQKNQYQGIINLPSSVNIYDSNNDINIKKIEVGICKLRLQYLITISILIVIIFDIFIEIYNSFINYFGMIDNIIVFFLVIKLLSLCFHKKNFYSKKLSLIIAMIIFLGFCIKGFSFAYCMMKEDVNLVVIYGILICLRTFGLIWLFPFTCRK